MSNWRDDQMQPMGDVHYHYWLTLGMAKAVGVSLTEALHSGQITRSQYADIVTRCRGCVWNGPCTEWLSRQSGIADAVPETCNNHATFLALKEGKSLAEEASLPA